MYVLYSAIDTLRQLEELESERDQWQRPGEVLQALDLQPGNVVADLGSGAGYFALKLSPIVGKKGQVLAVDIRKLSLSFLWIRALLNRKLNPNKGGGIFAFRVDNGERMWQTPPPGCGDRRPCSPAQSAAITAIPGAVFSGSADGHLRAYSTSDGHIAWDFDTAREFKTVNGVPGHGGAIDVAGPVVAGACCSPSPAILRGAAWAAMCCWLSERSRIRRGSATIEGAHVRHLSGYGPGD